MKAENLSYRNHGAISIVQFRTGNSVTFKYISLSEALKKKYAEINEVSESGSVNDLKIKNNSEHFIFMSDGDILSGAKQNRVLNTSVLLAPLSEVIIPVSCVEQGRWRYSKRDFSETDYSAPVFMRSGKARDVKHNLKTHKRHSADQSNVWSDVREYEEAYKYRSATSNLSDIFDDKRLDIERLINSFKPAEDSNGIAIFVNKRLLSLEIFNRKEVYKEYFEKLLKSVSFEAVNIREDKNVLSEAEAFDRTLKLTESFQILHYEIHKGAGAGIEKRFETEGMTGFELEYEGHSIHFVALNLNRDKDKDEKKIITGSDGRKIFNFGKYRGMTIQDVYEHNPEYIKWLCFESEIKKEDKKKIYKEILKCSEN